MSKIEELWIKANLDEAKERLEKNQVTIPQEYYDVVNDLTSEIFRLKNALAGHQEAVEINRALEGRLKDLESKVNTNTDDVKEIRREIIKNHPDCNLFNEEAARKALRCGDCDCSGQP